MASPLSNAQKRELKGRAQRMDASLKIGRAGLSEEWLKNLDEALSAHELVKVRFADFKEEKKQLAPEIAVRSGSELVTMVGNVAVFFRAKPAAERG